MRPLDNLETPEWVARHFSHFQLDPCAGPATSICQENWSIHRHEDGLQRDWTGTWFCNPPFSQKDAWIRKCLKERYHGGILLLPERGSAPWFGPLAARADYLWVMGKKINFIGGPSSNNLGTVLFCFGDEAADAIVHSDLPGLMVRPDFYRARNAEFTEHAD